MKRFLVLVLPGLFALAPSVANAADGRTAVAALPTLPAVCWGAYHSPTDSSPGMSGARILRFGPDGQAIILAKAGDDAMKQPWDGRGSTPLGYFLVGQTTKVVAVDGRLQQLSALWQKNPFELQLAMTGSGEYVVDVFNASHVLVAHDLMRCDK